MIATMISGGTPYSRSARSSSPRCARRYATPPSIRSCDEELRRVFEPLRRLENRPLHRRDDFRLKPRGCESAVELASREALLDRQLVDERLHVVRAAHSSARSRRRASFAASTGAANISREKATHRRDAARKWRARESRHEEISRMLSSPPPAYARAHRRRCRASIRCFVRCCSPLDPETAHDIVFRGLDAAAALGIAQLASPRLPPIAGRARWASSSRIASDSPPGSTRTPRISTGSRRSASASSKRAP